MPEGLQLYSKETPTQVFPLKFAKFLRTSFLKNVCERLLQEIELLKSRNPLTFCFWICKNTKDNHIEIFEEVDVAFSRALPQEYWIKHFQRQPVNNVSSPSQHTRPQMYGDAQREKCPLEQYSQALEKSTSNIQI